MKIPLILGHIEASDIRISMSGLRWLCSNGQYCKKGAPIAYCNIQLLKKGEPLNLIGEVHDFQAIFITPVDGFVHIHGATSYGGLIDQLPYYFFWNSKSVICEIECKDRDLLVGALPLQIIFVTGKRYMDASENRTGILSGWFERTRAWTGDRDHIKNTILTLGVCDILNGLRGEEIISINLLGLIPDPSQVILFQDSVLIPTAAMLLDQINLTPQNWSEVIKNFSDSIKNNSQVFEPEEYIFLGAILKSLVKNHFLTPSLTLTRSGINEFTHANIVLTSLTAQPRKLFRHKDLGYSIAFHEFRLREIGVATRKWLRDNFLLVSRDPDDISLEFRNLSKLLGKNTRLLVCNMPSNPLSNFNSKYDLFDKATFKEIADVNQREMNVMLDGLATERILEVVDLNFLSTHLGTASSYPDGIHMSGALENAFVNELARIIIKG